MKKLLSVILMLALLIACMPAALASGTKTYVATGKCYMRDEPNKSADLVGTLPKGASINATEVATDSRGVKWVFGSYGSSFGWVSTKNLKVKKGDDPKDPKEKKKNVTLETTGKCNLRKDADKDSKTLGTLPKGTIFQSTKSRVDDRGVRWYYGKYNGTSGWVSEKNLQKTSKKPDPTPTKKNVTMVTTGKCNLRKGPSKDDAIIAAIAAGKKLKSTKNAQDSRGVKWYYGDIDGKTGWISEANLKKASSDPTPKPAPKKIDYSDFVDCNCNGRVISKTLNMRMAPSTDYDIIHTYDNGEILYVARTNGEWAEVDDPALGLHGYVAIKYLERVNDAVTVVSCETVNLAAPADGIYMASFTADDLFRSESGSRMLRLNIFTQDLFDIVEISQLKQGDTIVLGGTPVKVSTLARDTMIIINGTYILQPVEEGSCYSAFTADGTLYTDQGTTLLPIAEDIEIPFGAQYVVIESGLITAIK